MKTHFFITCIIIGLWSCQDPTPNTQARFTVTINNLSSNETSVLLSDGVYYTHKKGYPLFFNFSQDYGQGLEALAEDGFTSELETSLNSNKYVLTSNRFGPMNAGESISFVVNAEYGDFLNFATMFTESNDLFYSFDDEGVALFNPNGDPFNGDITSKVWLWDAGTETNEEPYIGGFQPTRQPSPNTGEATIQPIIIVNDGFTYPPKKRIIQVLITSEEI